MLYVPLEWKVMARQHRGIIAGGALRDLITGRMPPKDVDIFVPGLREDECKDNFEAYAKGYFTVDNIEHGDTRFQIIKHRWPYEGEKWYFLDRFDIGLCKVAYCPFDGWHFTEEFVNDLANRTLTVLNTEHFNHEGHLASVQSRYPDYTLVPYSDPLAGLFN